MKKTDLVSGLKALIAKFSEAHKPAAETEAEKKPEAPAAEGAPVVGDPASTPAPEGVKEEGEKTPEGAAAPGAEDFAAKQKPADNVDYEAIAAELQTLRQKVAILDEYTYLKDRQTQLENAVNQSNQNFAAALELIGKFFDLPTGEPVQTPKSGPNKSAKKDARAEWAEAFAGLKKAAK